MCLIKYFFYKNKFIQVQSGCFSIILIVYNTVKLFRIILLIKIYKISTKIENDITNSCSAIAFR